MDLFSILFPVISLILFFGLVSSAIKAIRQKNYLDLISTLLLFPFFLFFFISVLLGGSPARDAKLTYEHYQAGHYYLMSHGDYTEVSYGVYLFSILLEVVGLFSLPLSLVWAIIREIITAVRRGRK